MALKRTVRLSLIAFGIIAPALSCWQPAFAETLTLWCGSDNNGYNLKIVVDFTNKTAYWQGIGPFNAEITPYLISFQYKHSESVNGGTSVESNWFQINRVTGAYMRRWHGWFEYHGREQPGSEKNFHDAEKCVKSDKPPAPAKRKF